MIKREVYCNLCGSKFDFWDDQEAYGVHKRCGYGSKNDGLRVDLDICCKCMDKLVESCVINPIETDLDEDYITEEFNED